MERGRKDERVINEAGRKRTGSDEGGKYGKEEEEEASEGNEGLHETALRVGN